MRKILPILLLATVAACALPQTRWEKEGADEKLTAGDLTSCRQAARDEAFVGYPYGFGSPFYGFHRWAHWDDDRFYAEGRLTDFCMRNKGYQLVTIPPPQAAPAVPTPAPEK
jgi:hypothetical protein